MESFELLKILEEFSSLKSEIAKLIASFQNPSHSSKMNELFTALCKTQQKMESADLNGSNPYLKTKYADLTSMVRASRPYLTEQGLCVLQHILPNEEGANFLHTKLCHSSGQWIESKIRIVPPKSDIQSLGSYITYLRRYSYAAIVGIVSSDEDDDGEKAMQLDKKENNNDIKNVIDDSQIDILKNEFKKNPEVVKNVLIDFKIKKFADIHKNIFPKVIHRIEEIKVARKIA